MLISLLFEYIPTNFNCQWPERKNFTKCKSFNCRNIKTQMKIKLLIDKWNTDIDVPFIFFCL